MMKGTAHASWPVVTGMVAAVMAACVAQSAVQEAPGLPGVPQAGQPGALDPVALRDVRITSGLWAQRQATLVESALPHAFEKARGNFEDFARAAGIMKGSAHGAPWDDAIPYCIMNAAVCSLAWHPDPALEKKLDDCIGWIAAAMEPDGYIYTARKLRPPNELSPEWAYERWVNMRYSHEEFNAGHLIDAACAHYEVTGKTNFLALARRNADLWASLFHPDGLNHLTGHETIKMALVRLSRDTGEKKYFDCARYLLDNRCSKRPNTYKGNWKFPDSYFQCHLPVRQQREALGHQVRAGYLYTAMADIAGESGDASLTQALEAIWQDYAERKLYLTGGGACGGVEDFGPTYYMPNPDAYCETCAAVTMGVLFNHRMALLLRDAKYLDVMERSLLNNALGGIGLDGKTFFYVNRLSVGKKNSAKERRIPWPGLACCPPNLLRLMASLGKYYYATAPGSLYVNLYGENRATAKVDGAAVSLIQKTDYPWNGRVLLSLSPAPPREFTVCLRIPCWAQGRPLSTDLYRYEDPTPAEWTIAVNGQRLKPAVEKGYAAIRRVWKDGDTVELDLPMPVRRVLAHEKIEDDRGRVALERGPLVYCAEGADNGGSTAGLVLDRPCRWETEFRHDLLGGVTVIRGEGRRILDGKVQEAKVNVTLVPYFARANRGADDMDVWLLAQPPKGAISR